MKVIFSAVTSVVVSTAGALNMTAKAVEHTAAAACNVARIMDEESAILYEESRDERLERAALRLASRQERGITLVTAPAVAEAA